MIPLEAESLLQNRLGLLFMRNAQRPNHPISYEWVTV